MSAVGQLTVQVQGVERLATAFKTTLPNNVRRELRRAVDRAGLMLVREVKQNWLTGPRPTKLGVLTGTLRRSINMERVDTATEVGATVGTNLIYGAAWELGHVKNWQKQVQPARPFLQPALMTLRQQIRLEISMAVARALGRMP